MGEGADTRLALGYHLVREAWYATTPPFDDVVVNVGMFAVGTRGCRWEFSVRESSDGRLRFDVAEDSGDAFLEIPKFFAEFTRMGPLVTLDEVVDLLDSLGIADMTKRVNDTPFMSGRRPQP